MEQAAQKTTQETAQKTREKAREKTVEKIHTRIMANRQIMRQKLMDRTGLTRRGVDRKNRGLTEGLKSAQEISLVRLPSS